MLLFSPAHADTPEDRLRDALRQSVAQMRAAQDQAAQAQADLQQAQADKAALQAKLDAATAKLAAPAPAAPREDVAAMQAALAAGRSQNAALQRAVAAGQLATQNAARQASSLDADAKRLQAGLARDTAALAACRAQNTRLAGVAESILHLYQTQDFRGLLLRSYEPLIGTAKVRLENLVQDYDDKIQDQTIPPVPAGK